MKKLNLLLFAFIIAFASCKKDEEPVVEEEKDYTSGAYVACEGTFGNVNASLSWIGETGLNDNNVFNTANGASLGDVAQDITIINGMAYVVVNNSAKVEVIRLADFGQLATITGSTYPRQIHQVSSTKAYLSDGSGAGVVQIIDLESNTQVGSIAVGNGPEGICSNDNFVFVCNSGGWEYDSTVSVIDPSTDTVIETVEVGDRPMECVADSNGDVWVLCAGDVVYDENWEIVSETQGKLVKLSGSDFSIGGELVIGEVGDHPSELAINGTGTKIYFLNHGAYNVDISTGEPSGVIFSGEYSAIAIDPSSSEIFVGVTPDFVNNGSIQIYSAGGSLIDTYAVGIAPNSIDFN